MSVPYQRCAVVYTLATNLLVCYASLPGPSIFTDPSIAFAQSLDSHLSPPLPRTYSPSTIPSTLAFVVDKPFLRRLWCQPTIYLSSLSIPLTPPSACTPPCAPARRPSSKRCRLCVVANGASWRRIRLDGVKRIWGHRGAGEGGMPLSLWGGGCSPSPSQPAAVALSIYQVQGTFLFI